MNHPNDRYLSAAIKGFRFAALSLAGLLIASSAPFSASAQLPPVNMGRWVKQPGDNQYSNDTQQSRHGGGPQAHHQVVPQQTAVMPMQQAPAWRPTPRVNRPDPSLEPIVCDEPIAPVGFAPLPESLDLPGVRGSSAYVGGGMGPRSSGMGGGVGGGSTFSSSYQGSGAPGLGGGGGNLGNPEITHSSGGYNNVAPGAFVKKKTPYGAANNIAPGSAGGDVYASGDGASNAPPMSDAQRAMQRLGPEPSLGKGPSASPSAPQPVQVNQATTQDLSLPDDEYKSSGSKKSTSQAGKFVKRTARRVGRQMVQPLNQLPIPRFRLK